jgi:hypothetical protein
LFVRRCPNVVEGVDDVDDVDDEEMLVDGEVSVNESVSEVEVEVGRGRCRRALLSECGGNRDVIAKRMDFKTINIKEIEIANVFYC